MDIIAVIVQKNSIQLVLFPFELVDLYHILVTTEEMATSVKHAGIPETAFLHHSA